MEEHVKWWKKRYAGFIRNKTRREISEKSWRGALLLASVWVEELAAQNGNLYDLKQLIRKELDL